MASREHAHDPYRAILDSVPLLACQLVRASYWRRFRGAAAYGKEHVVKERFFGLRLHARLYWPGVLTRICIVPALTESILGGRRLALLTAVPAGGAAAGRRAVVDPLPSWSPASSGRCNVATWPRFRIDTVFGQVIERGALKRI